MSGLGSGVTLVVRKVQPDRYAFVIPDRFSSTMAEPERGTPPVSLKMTPAMAQYWSIKEQHRDAILLFHIGDFYETFGTDAEILSRELDIALTSRSKDGSGNKVPLAGVPCHAVEGYIARLIGKGYRVAICDQVEDAKNAKGIVKREGVRVITPGTVIYEGLLSSAMACYLMAVAGDDRSSDLGMAFLDLSTGEFFVTQLYSLRGEFIKNGPSTLNKVRDYGVRIVETAGTYNLTPEKFRSLLDTNKLRAVAGHSPYDAYRTNLDGIIRDAKVLGLWYVGCAWIPHEGDFDEKECRDAIALFNQAGAEHDKHNLKFYYHAHGYEFRPHGNGTLLDLMMAETKPEHVFYEMDVYWVVHPSKDPVQLLDKYGKRWLMLHLKEMRKGVKGDL